MHTAAPYNIFRLLVPATDTTAPNAPTIELEGARWTTTRAFLFCLLLLATSSGFCGEPLEHWTYRTSVGNAPLLTSIIYTQGLFVTVGSFALNSAAMFIPPDGVT